MITIYVYNMAFLPRIRKSSLRLVGGWSIQAAFFIASLFVPNAKIWVVPVLWIVGVAIHQVSTRPGWVDASCCSPPAPPRATIPHPCPCAVDWTPR